MIKLLFQKLLNKAGKNYTIDPLIPSNLLVSNLLQRLIMMSRGYFWLYRKIFLGKGSHISNKRNIAFGNNITIENYVNIDGFAKNKLIFGNNVKIGAYSWISCTSHMSKYGEGISIGNNSAFGRYTEFGAAGGIQIGNDVIAGSYISFHSENHNFGDLSKLIREQGVTSKGIKVGNNVWIGAKVTFLDGSEIGDNCVVAAGAVVNGVFPDNVVIGGVPAKIIKTIA
ncbi:acetyl transferase [Flavobacteria bacterium BAL38]|uniref:acyltransferase n=1 Tax=unclassified Flavobacterium TaxID=196869 RepID=UPI0000F396ED|nr:MULTISPECIES: acyltransferase [unclassified Flavobacterium]EAZ96834.1 acetyl transferase [Flavobacteria bacterium BAL38]MQP51523.1 acyltransferase [Flavobacterium sp. LMO9]MQP61249.1 acyltransferase [Flavobacterium sp. LMO6]